MSLRVPGGRRRGWANRLPAGLEAMVKTLALAGHAPAAIDLNQPGSYLNWNVFTISVANLVLIAVMVAIFGAALLLPFPRGRGEDAAVPDPAPDAGIAPGDERMWTARARRRVLFFFSSRRRHTRWTGDWSSDVCSSD